MEKKPLNAALLCKCQDPMLSDSGHCWKCGGMMSQSQKNYKAKLNNEEFIMHLMQYSKFGALAQIFVLEAVRFYANAIIERGMPEQDDDRALISGKAWFMCAKEISEKIKVNYESDSKEESEKKGTDNDE